ncbi:MAG: hypothetical protein OXN16_12860 [Gammaproteobacteria bacterium]|nr:hypothetical protein [Gammaproteobacteria bacterium]MDE0281947.1 hypothetical protein [Gammaproteobacteria bacterium]
MASKHGKRLERAIEALLKAAHDLVECPDPVDGEVDEDTRLANRCTAVAAVLGALPAADAARVLANTAATLEEEREDCDGCLSMLVGEAVRLQVLDHAFDLADLDPARGLYEDDAGEMAF